MKENKSKCKKPQKSQGRIGTSAAEMENWGRERRLKPIRVAEMFPLSLRQRNAEIKNPKK